MKEPQGKPDFNGKYENAVNRQKLPSSSDKVFISERMFKLYYSAIRKFLMISYLIINAIFYGIGRNLGLPSDYKLSQGLECFMILLMLGDILLYVYLTRLVSK